jgi:hypothetical protein
MGRAQAGFQDGCLGGRGASPDSKKPLPRVRGAFPRTREGLADGQAGGEGKPSLTLPSQASAVLLVRAGSLDAGGGFWRNPDKQKTDYVHHKWEQFPLSGLLLPTSNARCTYGHNA